MIEKRLKTANDLLLKIIKLTEQGISDIKQAKKDRLEAQNKEKIEALNAFTKEKQALDMVLLDLANSSDLPLSELLSSEANDLLQQLRFNLNYLLAKNKEYARLVVSVKEFYDSLLAEILKDNVEIDGYSKNYTSNTMLNKRI